MNNNLSNKGINNRAKKHNFFAEQNEKNEDHSKEEQSSTRDVELSRSEQGPEDLTSYNSTKSKYVSIHCSPEDHERLKVLSVMNDTSMIHLVALGVQHIATSEDFQPENKVENLKKYTTFRIYPEDRKTLKRAALKYRTTIVNLIANMTDYLEERYK